MFTTLSERNWNFKHLKLLYYQFTLLVNSNQLYQKHITPKRITSPYMFRTEAYNMLLVVFLIVFLCFRQGISVFRIIIDVVNMPKDVKTTYLLD